MTRTFNARISRVRYKPNLHGLWRKADIFAEYLACGYEIAEIADTMGMSRGYANAVMQRIRKSLGSQAI